MSETGYHYHVIRRAIAAIDAAEQELSLEALCSKMQMSPAHFQKIFSRWAGVSPKRYQQFLRLSHAKTLLRERFTTMHTASHIGLSEGGRLHELFLRWEAMSPGIYASGGSGLEIFFSWQDSPFGEALVMATKDGICGIAFGAECGRNASMEDMKNRWPKAKYVRDELHIKPLVEIAFSAKGKLKLCPFGAPFQIKVWEALLSIPSGYVTTYSEIAQTIGHPKAVRAVGNAVGRNPISWLIPCHRVLRKSGALGGYHWGLPVKRALLAHESAAHESAARENTEKIAKAPRAR